MPAVTIDYDFPGCIGCGACESTCPDVWEMKEHNGELRAFLKKTNIPESEFQKNMETAKCCPVSVIHLIETATKKRLI